jgi:DNA-binding transcriptional ArsR family regulator
MHPFAVFAEPIRRRIVEILASGEHPSGILAECITFEFGVGRSTTSHHLKILREEGWVNVREEWSNRMYSLEITAFEQLEEEVHRLRQIWERRIGTAARNDQLPTHALPIQPRRAQRSSFAAKRARAEKRGRRARKADPWNPETWNR